MLYLPFFGSIIKKNDDVEELIPRPDEPAKYGYY
jgi:hypothetical protein